MSSIVLPSQFAASDLIDRPVPGGERHFGDSQDLALLAYNAHNSPQVSLELLECWYASTNVSISGEAALLERFQRLSDSELGTLVNCTTNYSTNASSIAATDRKNQIVLRLSTPFAYWALLLFVFPVLTAFGNALVVLSVFREKSFRTPTNYFIVSLAFADIMVGVLVMPFAVLLEFFGKWIFGSTLCDIWTALDVMNSTASILNLTAISIDRYVAVTQPIRYAQQENIKRTIIMIIISWSISVGLATPLVIGANDVENREAEICMFNSPDFLIYSSIASFYIPLVIVVCLYFRIFKAIHNRTRLMRNSTRSFRPSLKIMNHSDRSMSVFESAREDHDVTIHLSTQINSMDDSPERSRISDNSSRHTSHQSSPRVYPNSIESYSLMDTINEDTAAPSTRRSKSRTDLKAPHTRSERSSMLSGDSAEVKSKFKVLTNRFTRSDRRGAVCGIKRESAAARRERRATFTLAVVLLAFLLTWFPFFILNILCAINVKLTLGIGSCNTRSLMRMLTWLGYLSSTINPIIYSYNAEFRKAYRQILAC